MASIRQPSFQGGVLSPTMHGRTDLEAYSKGLKTCTNFFISKHGAAVSRPGMIHCDTVPGNDDATRLIPFVYSDQTSFVLVVTTGGTIYVMKDGAFVQSGGSDYAITSHPWASANIAQLRWVQVGDVLFVTDGANPVQKITRVADDNWTIEDFDFDVHDYNGTGDPYIQDIGGIRDLALSDSSNSQRDWKYCVTTVDRWFNGNTAESLPRDVTQRRFSTIDPGTGAELVSYPDAPTEFVISSDHPVVLYFRGPAGLASLHEPFTISTRIYRGRGDLFGYVGEVEGDQYTAGSYSWIDYGDEPDYAIAPPAGFNPFIIYDSNDPTEVGTPIRTEYPQTLGIFEQRMVLGGTAYRPTRLWFSATNDYSNFDQPSIPTADGSIEVELASRRREQIRAIVGLDKLIVLTDSAVWAVGGGGGAPIAPTDLIEARVQSDIGSAAIDPLVIDNSILYVRAKGTGVRDLGFSNERGAFAGGDLSFFANHLFHGYSITRWCYQEDPHGVVWAVRSDGKLLSLTYVKDLGVYAWALHETNGTVLDIVSVPETEEDTVYLLTYRVGVYAIEKFSRRGGTTLLASVRGLDRTNDIVCLDAAKVVTGLPNISAPLLVDRLTSATITGLSWLGSQEAYAVADGVVMGPYTATGGAITLTAGGIPLSGTDLPYVVHIGLRYNCDLELLDLADSRDRQKTVKKVSFDVESSRGGWAGEDFSNLFEWQQRTVGDNFDPLALTSTTAEVRIGSTWNKHGRACIRQVDPLPLTVLGVEREVVGGG